MPFPIEWLTLAIVPAVAILLVFVVVWQHKITQRQLLLQTERMEELQQALNISRAEVEELRNGVIGVGQRILSAERLLQQLQLSQQSQAAELEQLSEHQQKIQLADPESKLYSRAMKMVQLGAGLDEIMQECELPRAEAELLLNLHRQQQG
ncbi:MULTISPECIES: DUF2802 domain-containing protein [unclassified Rheinheimera]|uniref:DUF2802 domain-containing protein n=1 Tax=unclassified Rheinheimera TaxID=115860 RepID=UPI0021B139B8|nr:MULTISPECIES: DUF2802 domain-containing protein [unclassified Rheinheimera]MCT6700607.1 DUF2802 domain-containing protein [Rheinheimera sp. 4Y26]